jgi:short subunit dehydrogenase-like uncharacterized protein
VDGERRYDLALFGATGFTGGLTAEYLAEHAPADLRWALVGRNRAKLESVAARLAAIDSEVPAPDLLEADASDRDALDEVAKATRVVVTTVGPYIVHGEPIVAACAANGTNYADLTGEPEFVDRMWLAHHAEAERTGARLVHCCGFDSIPHDLGAYFTVSQLPEGVPLTVNGYVRANARFSGGSFHSAVGIFARSRQTLAAARERRRRESRPEGRRVRTASPGVRRLRELGGWAGPLPTIDGTVVRRSASALDLTYGHNIHSKHLGSLAALGGGAGALGLIAPLPPARKLLLKLKSPGEGPSEEERERSWFKVTFVGEGGGERVVTQVAGGDPGYSETAKMLAESGLSLARDELPPRAGQLTTAAAMGDMLLTRLNAAGIPFRVLDPAQS